MVIASTFDTEQIARRRTAFARLSDSPWDP